MIKEKSPLAKSKKVGKARTILEMISIAFLYIILPYYGLIYASTTFINKPIIFYQLNDLILFGTPIIVAKSLKLYSRTVLISEVLSTLFNILYIIFIIGRALYAEFGLYSGELFNVAFQVNIAPYLLLVIAITALKGLINSLKVYYGY